MGTAVMTGEPVGDLPLEVLTIFMGDDASPWLRGALIRFLIQMKFKPIEALEEARQLNEAVQAWCRFVDEAGPAH